jgi:hypothetical protein
MIQPNAKEERVIQLQFQPHGRSIDGKTPEVVGLQSTGHRFLSVFFYKTYLHTKFTRADNIPRECIQRIVEDGLMVKELVGRYQIHQTHGFHVFDAIPFSPLQTLL